MSYILSNLPTKLPHPPHLRPAICHAFPRTCPNRRCGNICFARRTQCNLCGTEKPTDWTPAHLKQEEGAWLFRGWGPGEDSENRGS